MLALLQEQRQNHKTNHLCRSLENCETSLRQKLSIPIYMYMNFKKGQNSRMAFKDGDQNK